MDNLWHLGDEFRGQSKVVEDRQWSLMTSKLAEITKSKAERMNDFDYARMNPVPDMKQWDRLPYHQDDNKMDHLNLGLMNLDFKMNDLKMNEAAMKYPFRNMPYNMNQMYPKGNNGNVNSFKMNAGVNKFSNNINGKEANGKHNGSNNNSGSNSNNNSVDKRFKTLPTSEMLPRNEVLGGYIFVCTDRRLCSPPQPPPPTPPRELRAADAMAEEEGTQQLDFVKETVLKKRKVNEDWAIKNRERKAAKRQRRRNDAKGAIKRPEDFVREFRNKELDLNRMRTRLKVRKLRPAEAVDSKLLFAIRIPGTTDVHPDIRRILAKLRLTQVLTGVFLRATESNLKRLAAVELFVTYGFPNLKNVKELIYKKGRGYFDKEPFPLTSNDLIEKALGEHGVICLEDVVHEISTVGSHFSETSRFLMPFKLKCPERRLQMKKKPFKAGGDTGNRGEKINELIEKLN